MADKMYHVDVARDDVGNLSEVLENIATRKDHVRIVSITWQPARPGEGSKSHLAGYTIISEMDV